MLSRELHLSALRKRLKEFPVVAIIGARQVGKTTLARHLATEATRAVRYFDLENPTDLAALRDPMLALSGLRGLVVIDEVQHLPGLFKTLRVLADRPRKPARFLVLGSASIDLLRQSAESLAGRISYYELDGFNLAEVGASKVDRLWLRGGFPRAYTASNNEKSFAWREEFIRTFLERDMPQLGYQLPAQTMRRFWLMLAHWHGQIWNASEFGRALGFSDQTARRYLDALSSALVVRQIHPWHANIAKRQIKSPKVYVQDSGIAHALLGIRTADALLSHPKVGASWEGFVVSEIIRSLNLRSDDCFFWGTHSGAELDLFTQYRSRAIGFEIKRTLTPQMTPSISAAIDALQLQHVYVVYPGDQVFPLAPNVSAVPLVKLVEQMTKRF